ncbi:MAG: hypothetical protein ACTHLV_15965 [Achromobacter mucicolens]
MKKLLPLIAAATVSAFTGDTQAQASAPHSYCFKPCTTSLSGRLSVEHVRMDDPKMHFDAYILSLPDPISVPESSMFQEVRRESHVQLEFVPNNQRHLVGQCVVATGELTGPITASDIGSLVMQIQSLHACKADTP